MKRTLLVLAGLVVLLSSCKRSNIHWWDDGSTAKEEKIFRFDRLVDEFVSLNSFTSLQTMNTEYPLPTRLLIEDVLSVGTVEEPHVEQRLREYYLDSTMQVLLEDVHDEYYDLSAEERELSSVFHQIKEADPTFKIPFMYAQISGLNQSIVVGDSLLGISLDKYLGRDYPLYFKYYYDYQRRVMDRSRLVPDALFFYLSHEYPLASDKVHTLLDYIVEFGKLHWLIARGRHVSIAEEVGFEEERIKWYRENEGRVWQWLKGHGALHTADLTVIRHFMMPSGSTPYAGNDSPDQVGLWLGLQIVDHYMDTHPEVTVAELLRKNDADEILRESGYSPEIKVK